ncbi:hypothetical protein CH063_00420 [Colletotrichum higginsianum]|uniref:Uncharacterized protein n=1 Tax=Colletotrichum higginsianum (strain IMI 349063) TaxID=759273 RepID=H1VPC2_COLHI|nr:hypothetical protein CH063_00420 [Colletotrichum higginsianum]
MLVGHHDRTVDKASTRSSSSSCSSMTVHDDKSDRQFTSDGWASRPHSSRVTREGRLKRPVLSDNNNCNKPFRQKSSIMACVLYPIVAFAQVTPRFLVEKPRTPPSATRAYTCLYMYVKRKGMRDKNVRQESFPVWRTCLCVCVCVCACVSVSLRVKWRLATFVEYPNPSGGKERKKRKRNTSIVLSLSRQT